MSIPSAQQRLVNERDPSVPPWPRRYSVSFTLDGPLYDRLREAGDRQKLSLQTVLSQACEEWISDRETE